MPISFLARSSTISKPFLRSKSSAFKRWLVMSALPLSWACWESWLWSRHTSGKLPRPIHNCPCKTTRMVSSVQVTARCMGLKLAEKSWQ